MEENKSKRYITAIITIPLLLILAAAFFVLTDVNQKKNSYMSQPEESGYIDAQAVYNSNRNYGIMKNEIREYAVRVNKELAAKLAREHNAAKRAELKREAEKEVKLYAETLLQDIDRDVNNAINEVAENKNLKRVYISGSVKQNAKNMTPYVITELNMTVAQRLGGYLEKKQPEKVNIQPKFERQFNFNSYPVAKVPEQGITKEASGSISAAKNNAKGSIIADTQLLPKDKDERFIWERAKPNNIVKKAQPARQDKTRKKYVTAAKMELPAGKAQAITEGSKYALINSLAFIQSRNVALTKMQIMPAKAAENILAAKAAARQSAKHDKTRKVYTNAAKFELPESKAKAITEAGQYAVASGIAFIQERNLALTEVQMSLPKTGAEKTSVAKVVTEQPQIEKKTAAKPESVIASRPNQVTQAQIGAFLNMAAAKTYEIATLLKEHGSMAMTEMRNITALLYTKCADLWQNAYLSVQTKATLTEQTNKPAPDGKTGSIAGKQQTAETEAGKTEEAVKAVETAATVQETAEKTEKEADIKQIKQPAAVTQPDNVEQVSPKAEAAAKQNRAEKPKTETAEQKQEERQSVKADARTASNIVSKSVAIQVAACLNKGGADAAVRKLRGRQIPAHVQGVEKNGRKWWCVRVIVADSTQLNAYKQKLAAMGYSGVIVR